MQTIISKKHVTWETVGGEEREVVRLWIAVTSSSDLPTKRSIPGLTLHEGSRAWDISGAKNYGWTENGVWNEQVGGNAPGVVKIKGTVSSVSDLPSNAEPGWLYFVGLPTDDAYSEYVYTDDNRWEFIGYNTITVDDTLSTISENPVQNKVVTTALNNKVDKVTGKGLSTEDYTTAEKTKLSEIESGANKTVVDDYLSTVSTNPVQNRLISAAIINAYTPKHYGFKIDKSNSDPFTNVSYLHDAANLTPAAMDYQNSAFNYGSWGGSGENPWFIRDAYPVALRYDGVEDYKLDPNDYSKKIDGTASDIEDAAYEGNFMMAIPRIWFKRSDDGNHNTIEISDAQLDTNFHAYAHTDANGVIKDYIYLPLFKGSLMSGKLRSLAGKVPQSNTTAQNEIDAASANGTGWQIWDHSSRELICDLLTLIGKSTDSQTTFGKGQEAGYNSFAEDYGFVHTGTLKNKGMFFGYDTSYSDVKVFGIEGFWGIRWDRILGLILLDNVWKVKMVPPYNLTGNGFITPSGITVPTENNFLKTVHSSEYGSVPSSISGTSSTYFCDYFYKNASGARVALVGGTCSSGSNGGFRYVNVRTGASDSNWSVGASPVYK